MKRRNFIQLSSLGAVALAYPITGLGRFSTDHSPAFKKLISDLLKEWCDGMIRVQINNPANLSEHGALGCPSCSHIHGRCMDAVYPFLYMADLTGETKYAKAAILVMNWAENNVSQEDGSWTVIPNPNSWKGISVFGAIALAEALHYHGHVLDKEIYKSWTARLAKAGQYIFENFSISFTNINYGATAIYGLNLLGEVLNNPLFISKSKELAKGVKSYFTASEGLLFGECKPNSDKLSKKGLQGVDLGYNVEESLNSLVMYGLKEKDEELLHILTKTLNSHLEFMLPDGAWDNSWGTRQYKWSYWGSRTCDGSQPAFAMMAHVNPAFGTAAVRNTELLKRCTADGLLHGGPHFVSHGIKPCVHHTFAHAKPLATLLDHWKHLPEINSKTPLPRSKTQGVLHFKDLDVSLFSMANWRGTVSAYDAEYHYQHDYRQASGGSLGVLYHEKVGLLCSASMAVYKMVEENNQQLAPDNDIALTPRVETYKNSEWFTNLFDLEASVSSSVRNKEIEIIANAKLKNESKVTVQDTASNFEIVYKCTVNGFFITAKTKQSIKEKTAFVLPIVSKSGERINFKTKNEVIIQKLEGTITIKSNLPIRIKEMNGSRTFNMVPGVEAIPFEIFFVEQQRKIDLFITVS